MTASPGSALLEVENLVKHYHLPRERLLQPAPVVQALRGVSFTLQAGRSLGIVGESGSGKSTLARQAMALEPPTEGRVRLLGRDLNTLDARALREARRDFQMVFQDPYGSLDPRQRVARIVAEPLMDASPAEVRQRVVESLDAVGLRASDAAKYPHEFSGGQRQRVAIARALITRPKLIVADEPVSALDVSVQAQVLNLLADLQAQFGVTYLFISHDLAVVDHVCDEVAVMYAGRIVEQGSPEVLFQAAAHPYTRALMAAMPQAPGSSSAATLPAASARPAGNALPEGPTGLSPAGSGISNSSIRVAAESTAPHAAPSSATSSSADRSSPAAAPQACSFASRCPQRRQRCTDEMPALRSVAPHHLAACHFAEHVMTSGAPR